MCAGEPCVVASSRIDRLTYVRNEGLRTLDVALSFKVLVSGSRKLQKQNGAPICI
jgi:hypothetical protein